jgi:hypothetical protein
MLLPFADRIPPPISSPKEIIMRILALMLLFSLQTFPSAQAATIGIYTDPSGLGDALQLGFEESATLHVIAKTTASDLQGGVTSGGFRIVGIPNAWVASATAHPAINVVIGSVLADGALFAWPALQFDEIPLFTVSIFATTLEMDVYIQVVKHVTPSQQWGVILDCPWLHFSCGEPCDISGMCVDGGSLRINPTGLPVEEATWTAVRMLYR